VVHNRRMTPSRLKKKSPMKFVCHMAILFASCATLSEGQTPPVVTLDIETEWVAYNVDTADISKYGGSIGKIEAAPPSPNFASYVNIGDIVRVNGKPSRGTQLVYGIATRMRPIPTPGTAIADVSRNNFARIQLEIHDLDRREIGTIALDGFFGGTAPPGAPSSLFSNFTVTGGTGAFFGVRGQAVHAALTPLPGIRNASITEDPSQRRDFGNAFGLKYTLQLIPLSYPSIEGVFHADFQPVSASAPAQRGEVLIIRASGLGPLAATRFDAEAPSTAIEVNSPVEVTVGGRAAELINKIGWPGARDIYRIDFRVPEAASGVADLQLTSAWIPGAAVKIPIR
jgi:hypothetical protein